MTTRVCLAQLSVRPSKRENLELVLSTIDKAEKTCDLIIFPEYTMGYPTDGLSRKYVQDVAEPLTGPFITTIAERSKASTVVVPIYEKADSAVFNAAVVIAHGKVLGRYRKVHLFDALGWRESDLFQPGTNPVVFSVGDLKVGIVICYDIRFPELIRSEVFSGARAIIAPAGWVKGPLKEEQWQTLLMARAHENTSYMIGVGNANPAFVGRSAVMDPFGIKIVDLGSGEGIGFCEIDEHKIRKAREILPVVDQARSSRYRPCLQI